MIVDTLGVYCMLIYVLDFFDGGLKPPKPPLESATDKILINFKELKNKRFL
jgi:hypothetical protein